MENTTSYRFIYEGNEVVLTGRKAHRKLRNGNVDVIYEITPYNTEVNKWTKWVHYEELYSITKE